MNKKQFRSLELVARKYLDSYSSGNHPTLLKDSLIEVDVVREYQPGDKRLDSKSSLKAGKTMSRVFNPERSLNLFVILDISSSQYTKLDAAVVTALYLCYLGDINNERVGLCVFSDYVSTITEITDDYSSTVGIIEKAWNDLRMNSGTSVEESLKKVGDIGLTNSIVVFISDFCYPLTDSLLNSIKKIALVPTNSFLSVVLANPVDWLIPFNSNLNITFKDAETGSVGIYNANSAKTDFDKWTREIKKQLLGCNSETITLNVKDERFLLPLVKHLMRN